ncbi:unnamed protein product [Ophioblennius macclurei]
MRVTTNLHLHHPLLLFLLLRLGGFCCFASSPSAFSARSQTDESHWDQDDLKIINDLTRSSRHADGLFTSGYSRLLSQMTAKDYLESLKTKRFRDNHIENPFPVKRHSDAVFTNKYSRFRKQMAAKKYLSFILQGKRSVEDPTLTEVSIDPDSTSAQALEDSRIYDIIGKLTAAP